jgi:hypothetical protein
VAVIVQSVRLTKSFQTIRSSTLDESIAQLDRSTGQAKAVLAELKTLLSTDGVAQTRAIKDGEVLRDELSVMVGIGNAVAERIMEAVASQNTARQDDALREGVEESATGAEPAVAAAAPSGCQSRRSSVRKARSRDTARRKGVPSGAGKQQSAVHA